MWLCLGQWGLQGWWDDNSQKGSNTDFIVLPMEDIRPRCSGACGPYMGLVGSVERTGGTRYPRWNRICDWSHCLLEPRRAMLTPKHSGLQGFSARERRMMGRMLNSPVASQSWCPPLDTQQDWSAQGTGAASPCLCHPSDDIAVPGFEKAGLGWSYSDNPSAIGRKTTQPK